MCHKNCPPAADMKAKTKPVANPCKRSLVDLKLNPSRRSRTKTRRPKFLSLGLQLSPQTSSASAQMNLKPRRSRRIHLRHQQQQKQQQRQQQQQLDLFPQRPETTHPIDGDVDKLLDQLRDENDVSLLFDADNTDATTTLNGLLDSTAKASADADTHTAAAASSEEDSVSLIQCAMKSSRRRDHQNPCRQKEKWVCYSEVVEVEQQQESNNSKKEQEEVNSCDADAGCTVGTWQGSTTQMLSLKLDYQHILDAWSDKGKGSLFLRGNDQNEVAAPPSSPSPQTVPQWHNHYNHHLLLGHDCSPVNGVMMTDSWATSASDGSSVWRVPELKVGESERTRDANMECFCLEEKEGSDKMRQREASVLRYKEKRLNRLFYKRIRYEVRKLNAEKRPRIKGRFVRRSGQE